MDKQINFLVLSDWVFTNINSTDITENQLEEVSQYRKC